MTIAAVQADHYRIPLPVALSDSTHGTIAAFELVTARVRDGDGAEGLGYTYTVGAGGGAIHDLIARDLAPALLGADETRIEALWQKLGGGCTTSGAAASRSTPSRRSIPRSGTSRPAPRPPALAPARRP
jgi:L-alanine-DL-glutamate epimerase-like enolase superfamily enzyme